MSRLFDTMNIRYYDMSSSSTATTPGRARMVRPASSSDWEPYREVISQLYEEIRLKDVIIEMERSYNFKATEKQYKTQIKKWSLDTKYTKGSEYLAMIKTKRRRERGNPPKDTVFTLRGRPIDPKDIARFEKRAIKKGIITQDDGLSDQDSVDDLVYGTPPSAW
ncbi:hypothetical protein DL546_008856 [Coniochaeta pulveracea]|uniref:Clr5 domain-containing protein n=1 Tax=Coniochaeta pulveracea TaxID=177199 RepID=A0A420YLX3_9PEZI|nr:hypothetical protein DL546_008856 [Coniochaeta pulveracea]